jgi:hypothetical protein
MSRFKGCSNLSNAGCRAATLLVFLFLALGLSLPRASMAANDWTYTNPLPLGERDAHTATLLPSGQVLVVGGKASASVTTLTMPISAFRRVTGASPGNSSPGAGTPPPC